MYSTNEVLCVQMIRPGTKKKYVLVNYSVGFFLSFFRFFLPSFLVIVSMFHRLLASTFF